MGVHGCLAKRVCAERYCDSLEGQRIPARPGNSGCACSFSPSPAALNENTGFRSPDIRLWKLRFKCSQSSVAPGDLGVDLGRQQGAGGRQGNCMGPGIGNVCFQSGGKVGHFMNQGDSEGKGGHVT